MQAPGLHRSEGNLTVTYTWREPLLWHVESTHTKPHTTCKVARVLISVSVVLLSFLFSREWIFIFRSDFWFGSWFVIFICRHSSWVGCLGAKVTKVVEIRKGSPRMNSQVIVRGEISQRALVPWQAAVETSFPSGPSAVTRSPTWGFCFLFCVTYVMHLRAILGTFRLSCDLHVLCISLFPCFPLTSFGRKYFFLIN